MRGVNLLPALAHRSRPSTVDKKSFSIRQLPDLGVELLYPLFVVLGLHSVHAKHVLGAFHQALLPVLALIRMNVELLGQLGQCAFALHRCQSDLGLERRCVITSLSRVIFCSFSLENIKSEDPTYQFLFSVQPPGSTSELPRNDGAGIVVQDARQVKPAPADDLEIGAVGLPQRVRRRGLVAELIGCLDDHESGAGDQVVGLEKPVNRGLRDKVAPWCA